MTLTYVSPSDGVIDGRRLAGGVLLVIRASDTKRTATGLHAKLTIALAESESATQANPVTAHVFNLDNENYRHDFANALYGTRARRPKFSAAFIEAYPQDEFEQDLFDFSEQFYGQLMGFSKGGFVTGDPDKTTPKFWVDGLALQDGGTVIYAPPKSVKSYLLMLLLVSVDSGVDTFFRVTQTRAMLINLERGESLMRRRLGLINRVLGLPPERPLLMVNARGKRLVDVYDSTKELIDEQGVKIAGLDSLTRGGFGDLNGNEEANRAMDYLNRLCPAWVAIAHTPRQDDSHIFGSQMFDAALDIGINVRREKKEDGTVGVGLYVKETNDTGAPPPRILAFEFDQYGLNGIRNANRFEFPAIDEATQPPQTNRDIVYDQFLKFGRASVTQVAKDLQMNAGTVHGEVLALVSAGRLANLGREGRSIFYGVPAPSFEGQN